jgi:hypothetical protein
MLGSIQDFKDRIYLLARGRFRAEQVSRGTTGNGVMIGFSDRSEV